MALSVSHDHAHYPLIHTATYSIKKVSDEELVEWLGSDNVQDHVFRIHRAEVCRKIVFFLLHLVMLTSGAIMEA